MGNILNCNIELKLIKESGINRVRCKFGLGLEIGLVVRYFGIL